MTTEQAIAIIQEYLYRHRYGYISKNKEFDSLYKAMQVVIQALQAQADGKYISRQAVLDALKIYKVNLTVIDIIRGLPITTVAIPSALTTEDYTELRDRFGEYVEFVVRDMVSGKGERWERKGVAIPSAEPCEDAISRQALLKLMGEEPFNWTDSDKKLQAVEDYRGFRNMVEQLPSVKPQEPNTGHWEWVQYDSNPNIGNWHCSECRTIIPHMPEETDNTPIYKWCPMCGAKMVEPQEVRDKE